MKKILSLFFFLSPLLILSQNYKLFHSASKKLFASANSLMTFSLSFDTIRKTGSDSIYCNFYMLEGNLFNSPHCYFWGPPQCYRQNVPVWLGGDIKYNNAGIYQFYNLAGDTLTFNFNKKPGDSSVFYKNSSEKFVFKYIKADTLTVLNNLDSARFYIIHHTDLNGNVINSPIHNKYITVAKNFGLADFMQVDSFPQVLRPLKLIGNISPTAGFINITNEMLYDHQPGDEIQMYDYRYIYLGGLYQYKRYIKHTYLVRYNTTDSVSYKVRRSNYNVLTGGWTIDTIMLKYKKNFVLYQLPFEKYDGNIKKLFIGNYCSLKLWTYTIHRIYRYGYCPADKCWGDIDNNGPPPDDNISYVSGLGIYINTSNLIGGPTGGYSMGTNIIYFKKNGISCGNEIVMGINNNEEFLYNAELTPNPASAELTITSAALMKNVVVFDIMGQKIMSVNVMANDSKINISKLPEGVYVAKITFDNNKVISKKFIKTNQ